MDEPSRQLLDEAARGSLPAIDELLARHLPGLRAYIRLRASPTVRARESASDIAQSVCREILQNLDRFQYGGETGFRHWLYATALRRIQNKNDYWKAQKRDVGRERRVSGGTTDANAVELLECYRQFSTPSGKAVAREELQRIEAAFDGLNDEQREVIALAKIVGLSHEDIAEKMGKTPGATRVLLHRSLARLAGMLDDE